MSDDYDYERHSPEAVIASLPLLLKDAGVAVFNDIDQAGHILWLLDTLHDRAAMRREFAEREARMERGRRREAWWRERARS